jgi:prepilin-type processing-associated H-X9-DG protein
MPRRHPSAFTLAELLVVTGIIAVLIAILLPALNLARRHAQAAACIAHLHGIGIALTIYTQQSGYYPGLRCEFGTGVYVVWAPRLRQLMNGSQDSFYCPSRDPRFAWQKEGTLAPSFARATELHTGFGYEVGERLIDWQFTPFSYGYNGLTTEHSLGDLIYADMASIDPYVREQRAISVRVPDDMIAVADSNADGLEDSTIYFTESNNGQVGSVHFGGANVLFCDGHVQRLLKSELVLPNNYDGATARMITPRWFANHSTFGSGAN